MWWKTNKIFNGFRKKYILTSSSSSICSYIYGMQSGLVCIPKYVRDEDDWWYIVKCSFVVHASVFLCRPLLGARSAHAAGFSFFYLVCNFSITGNQTGFASSLQLRAIPIRSRTVWVYLLLPIPSLYYGNVSLISTHFSTSNELTVHNDKMISCVEKCCVLLWPTGKRFDHVIAYRQNDCNDDGVIVLETAGRFYATDNRFPIIRYPLSYIFFLNNCDSAQ